MDLWQVVVLGLAVLSIVCGKNRQFPDLTIECGKGSVMVRWKVTKEMADNPSRIHLGSCHLSDLNRTEGGEAIFYSRFSECNFKRQRNDEKEIFMAKLSFKPDAWPKQPKDSVDVKCVYKRPKDLIPVSLSPGVGRVTGHSQLYFYMELLNEDLKGPAQSNAFSEGSFIPIWASVEQRGHQPLALFMDECVASNSIELGPHAQLYPIVMNHGCLVAGKVGDSHFLPRDDQSSVILNLQAFGLPVNREVYLHCELVAWEPGKLDSSKKMCNYNKSWRGWELLDNESRSGVCKCCNSFCGGRKIRTVHEELGLVQKTCLGPFIIERDGGYDQFTNI